jgi:hypothetical protein
MNENFLWIILLPFVAAWFWVSFIMPARKTASTCPDCAQPLSPFQSPFTKTKRMWFEGGYLCSHCGCEVSMDGQKVPFGTAPQRRSVTRGIGMLVITVLPTLIMIYIISQYKPVSPKLVVAPQKLIAIPDNADSTHNADSTP